MRFVRGVTETVKGCRGAPVGEGCDERDERREKPSVNCQSLIPLATLTGVHSGVGSENGRIAPIRLMGGFFQFNCKLVVVRLAGFFFIGSRFPWPPASRFDVRKTHIDHGGFESDFRLPRALA